MRRNLLSITGGTTRIRVKKGDTSALIRTAHNAALILSQPLLFVKAFSHMKPGFPPLRARLCSVPSVHLSCHCSDRGAHLPAHLEVLMRCSRWDTLLLNSSRHRGAAGEGVLLKAGLLVGSHHEPYRSVQSSTVLCSGYCAVTINDLSVK